MDLIEIFDEDLLLRRISEFQVDESNHMPSSAAFAGSDSHDLSVDLARLTTPAQSMEWGQVLNQPCVGVACFTVGEARALNQVVEHNPIPEGERDGPNPAHVLVKGEKASPKRKIARALSRCCRWIWPEELKQHNPPENT